MSNVKNFFLPSSSNSRDACAKETSVNAVLNIHRHTEYEQKLLKPMKE